MSTAARRLRTAARGLKYAWTQAGLTLIVLIVLELLVLVAYDARSESDPRAFADGYHHADWTIEYFKEYRRHTARWQPYSYWVGTTQSDKYINVDAEGLRRTWHSANGASACVHPTRIFMFGGSTMWGEGARDDETIASWLQRMLDARHVCAEVTNMGQDGYVSTQEVLFATEQIRHGNIPDLAIFYDGYNDVFAAEDNGSAGLTYNERRRKDEFNISQSSTRLLKEGLIRFVLHRAIGQLAVSLVAALKPDSYQALDGRLFNIGEAKTRAAGLANDERLEESVVHTYLSNKGFADAVAAKFGFHTLFYWQPCILNKNKLTSYERFAESKNFLAGEREFDLAIGRRMAAMEPKAGIHDLTAVFHDRSEPYFIDEAHVTGDGNRLIAEAMLNDVAAELDT